MVTHDPKSTDYATRTLHLEKGRLIENATNAESEHMSPALQGARS
jgi:ABC-type lipoprotein export system ATPase subunit